MTRTTLALAASLLLALSACGSPAPSVPCPPNDSPWPRCYCPASHPVMVCVYDHGQSATLEQGTWCRGTTDDDGGVYQPTPVCMTVHASDPRR